MIKNRYLQIANLNFLDSFQTKIAFHTIEMKNIGYGQIKRKFKIGLNNFEVKPDR